MSREYKLVFMKNHPLKKILFLLIFCLTSTLYVSGQTFKSQNGKQLLIKTSSTTWTLKFENQYGTVITEYLKLSAGPEDTEQRLGFGNYCKTYSIKSSTYYVIIEEIPNAHLITSMQYYNELGTEIWHVVGGLYKQ